MRFPKLCGMGLKIVETLSNQHIRLPFLPLSFPPSSAVNSTYRKCLYNEEVCLLVSIFFKFTLSLFLPFFHPPSFIAPLWHHNWQNGEENLYFSTYFPKAHHENFPRWKCLYSKRNFDGVDCGSYLWRKTPRKKRSRKRKSFRLIEQPEKRGKCFIRCNFMDILCSERAFILQAKRNVKCVYI